MVPRTGLYFGIIYTTVGMRYLKVFLTAALLALGLWCCAQTSGQGVLRPYDKNPGYWQYKDKPVVLLGASGDDNLFQMEDPEAHLDSMKAAGANYIRNTLSDRDPGNIRAFRRNSDGKYDLNQWNENYWTRLERLLKLTRDRDIVVQIEVWDRFDHSRNEWTADPFHPANNINYSFSASGLDSAYRMHPGQNKQPFFFSVPALNNNTLLLEYQEAFVRKLLSVSLKFDHVLYCIDNETSGREEWAVYWRDFIVKHSGGKEIYITEMWDEWDVKSEMHKRTIDHPERYNYIDISQNSQLPGYVNWQNQQYVFDYIGSDRRPVNSTKIYGSDRGHWLDRGITTEHAIQTFFRNMIGGFASSRFHRPPSGLGLSAPSIHAIQTVRKIEQHIKMWDITPRMDLLADVAQNEAYLAAREGEQYLLYFTGGGAVKLDLRKYPVNFTLRWIRIEDSSWGKTRRVKGGSFLSLQSPHATGSLAVLVAER